MRPLRILAVGTVVVALLVGCSNDAPGPNPGSATDDKTSPTSGSLPDPCTLVTRDAVAAAVGAPVGEGVGDLVSAPGLADGRECSFRGTGQRGVFTLDIWSITPDGFAADRQQAKGFGDVRDVAGVGDSAFSVGNNELHVLTKRYLLHLALEQVKFDPDASLQHLTALARSSIERL